MTTKSNLLNEQIIRPVISRLVDHKIIIAAFLATTLLGVLGFSEVFPDFNLLTRLYMSMQLFLLDPQTFDVSDTLGGEDSKSIPWKLELARWMAALITCYGVVYSFWILLQKSNELLKIQKLEGHTIVYGSGSSVAGLLDDLLEIDNCVLITPCPMLMESCRARGGLVVEINHDVDASISMHHLMRAGLDQASILYALDANDAHNLRVALLVEASNARPKIFVCQDEVYTCDLLQRNGLLLPDNKLPVHVISVSCIRARLLLRSSPLEWRNSTGLATEAHLVIPRLGVFEKAVAIQAAFIGHYPNNKRVHLWFESSSDYSTMLSEFPEISKCVHLHLIGENDINSVWEMSRTVASGALVTILATHLLPEDGYIKALQYRERWSSDNHFRVILSGVLANGNKMGSHADDIVAAPSFGGLVSPKNLDEHDVVAKKIHDTWYEGNARRINDALASGNKQQASELGSKPTFKPWNQLTEHQKDINRRAADHIEVKIRAAGLEVSQSNLNEEWTQLSSDQLDTLSRMEHERWAAPLWLAGYKQGERNDEKRRHPNLVPYDELDQSTKDFDVEQVKQAVSYFLTAGND